MSATLPCEYCGKIFSLDEHRRDKKCCSNLCSVKLNYSQKHNYLSPYQKHIGAELNYSHGGDLIRRPPTEKVEEQKPVIKTKSDDTSLTILQEAQNKLNEYKPYKN